MGLARFVNTLRFLTVGSLAVTTLDGWIVAQPAL
jgi:hypothetical protein